MKPTTKIISQKAYLVRKIRRLGRAVPPVVIWHWRQSVQNTTIANLRDDRPATFSDRHTMVLREKRRSSKRRSYTFVIDWDICLRASTIFSCKFLKSLIGLRAARNCNIIFTPASDVFEPSEMKVRLVTSDLISLLCCLRQDVNPRLPTCQSDSLPAGPSGAK